MYYEYTEYNEYHYTKTMSAIHKQPSWGVLRKRCSENMQQIYKRTPVPKCDFNKIAKQLSC